jgi:rhodanese-related sulfurtransferase
MYEEAARLVANRGYMNVKTFAGGIPAWQKAGFKLDTSRALPDVCHNQIDVDEFRDQFSKVAVVDIRIPALYKLGHYSRYMRSEIERTSLEHRKKYHHKMPLSKLSKTYAKIPKDRRIIVVDHNGKQSKLAGKFLLNNGFTEVYCLKGGLTALEKQ